MNYSIFPLILIVIWLVIFLAALIYHQYYAWFKPEEFKRKQVSNIKSWWSFQNFFTTWCNSRFYLWFVRIVFGLLLLATLLMISVSILGYSGIIP